ncbi:GMP synthase [Bdellovibrio bacteriovorus W]|nr:GMP synthase [Bdellovibrio bacteriovorus W]
MRGFIIIDFGSQFTQLIARRLRDLGYYSEIHSYKISTDEIRKKQPFGIILSGGPNSVFSEKSAQKNVAELGEIAPVLGICYGLQLMVHQLGGEVRKTTSPEYGRQEIQWQKSLGNIPKSHSVWMSHGDEIVRLPEGFEVYAKSSNGHIAAIGKDHFLALQFHAEAAHTEYGVDIFKHFAAEMCKAERNWSAPEIKNLLIQEVRAKVGDHDHVLVALSGGVDSSVVATLLTETLGADRVHCVFVDTGLLRKNEYEEVMTQYQKFGLNVKGINAKKEFLSALAGKIDPEQKRKTIGGLFIEIFEKSYDKSLPIKWLAQGTVYPDVIESVSFDGTVTIKSHHNVGGLPAKMNLGLVEPVRELFKDEVRALGKELGLPEKMLWRHPFPGPGLAIRVLGEVTEEKLNIMKEADAIFISELREHGLYGKMFQAFCVLLPVKTVGVQNDQRTYEYVLSLRAVSSSDGMTADWYPFEFEFLRKVSNMITNQVQGVNRVVYDVTSKPPGTIEWE